MANLFDQLEHVAWIPIEMTGFHQWKITEQWFVWLLWVLCRPYYTTFKVIGYLFFCHFWSKHISQYRTWIADRSAKLTSWISFELQWRINTYPRSFLWQFKHCGCNSLEWVLIYFRLLSVIFINCQNWTGNQGNNHVECGQHYEPAWFWCIKSTYEFTELQVRTFIRSDSNLLHEFVSTLMNE